MFGPSSKILVVDDMMTMRKIVIRSLKELGFTEFTEAEDGAKAWEKFSSGTGFDLVVSDWNMPNCTGLDLLKRIRSDSRFAKTSFILVTAESDKAQVVDALKSGVSAYVIKPFDTPTLKGKLEEAFKKAA
jgi:two-component system chemotaxis response regulator CheY